ncbi:MAG: hypothetical protein MJ090_05355 [Clostridia bacterium]|nr:hypothetical protein [Clostridia bacterium]
MKKPIIDLKKLIYNRKFLITVSVIISVVIWFVAMIVRNPVREQIFNDVPVSVSVDNTSAESLGLGIISDISSYKFSVKIKGPNYLVSTVKATDFSLSASVAEVNKPGTYALDVSATRTKDISGYSIVSIEPSKIDVSFDYIDTKSYAVTPKIVGISAADGLIAEAPIISDKEQKTITVKGPRSMINKISSVGSLTELARNVVLSSSKTYDSDIVLYDQNEQILYRYDADGNVYDGANNKVDNRSLTLSFTTVKITQPISKKATLNVDVMFDNMPTGLTKSKLSVSLNHRTATVIGTPEVIDKMENIELTAIDFRKISASSSGEFNVKAALPEGVKLFDNIDDFTVRLNLNNFSEKTFNINRLKYKGLSENLSAKSTLIKNVKICGPKDIINKLTAKDLYAEIDLSKKTAGEHNCDATIKSDSYDNIWQIGKYSASVVISKK